MALTLDFQGQILKKSLLRIWVPDWHKMKWIWVDWMSDPCCDFKLGPHPWPWTWIFNVNFLNSCIPGMGGLIDMERKVYELVGFIPTLWPWAMTLTLNFQGQILKILYLRNRRADWHGTKRMWVDRMLDAHCNFELWPQSWHWPWIFKVNFWKSCISGMGIPINWERKVYESIGCHTYYVTLSYGFGIGCWRSNFKKALS